MRVVDRCIVLDHGEVIAQGSPTEVANHPRVIEVYLGTDAAQVQGQVLRQGQRPDPRHTHQDPQQGAQQSSEQGAQQGSSRDLLQGPLQESDARSPPT